MRKQILVDNKTKRFLADSFGCTMQAVWFALTFQRNSEQARRMRTLALERGGKLAGGDVPECDTFFDEASKTMVQPFGERVKIVFDHTSDETSVYVDGEMKERRKGLGIDDFMQLQDEVRLMAAAL